MELNEDGELEKRFGPVLVTSTGDGLYAKDVKLTVPLELVVTVDPESIERNEDGSIDFAFVWFEARFDPAYWNSNVHGIMYTDTGIVKGVNNYLASLGYQGRVDWSERGRQEDTSANFDMDYELVDQFWPELLKALPPRAPAVSQ